MQLRKIKSWNNVSYFLSVSRNNSKQFCLFFRIFSVSQNDQNSAKQWAVSYSFAFRETKKTNTKLSTLVRIRFANYSKFVYMYFLCLLYAVSKVSVVIPSQSVSFAWQWKMRYLTLSKIEKAANPNWDESIYPSYPSERWGQILA